MAVVTGLLGVALLPAAAAETAGLEAACVSLDFGTSAVIDANGSLWMWGWNNYGQLGNGTTTDAHAPVKVMDNVSQVVTGGSSTAALKTDGTLWKWGVGNSFGDRNYGNATALDGSRCQTVPVKVMDDVAKINSSGWCRAAVKTDGSLWTWYVYDESGGSAVDTPVKVLDNVASVTVERTNVMRMAAITEDSSLWIWGANEWGQVGNGTAGGYETTPVKVMEDVASVSLEDFYTVALKTDGSLWAWGNNAFSRLGTGSGEASYTPIKIMEDVRSFTADYSQNAAITEDDSLWVWGFVYPGDGTANQVSYPVPTKIMDDVKSVTMAGMETMAVVKTDGSLWAWGGNFHGTVGNGTTSPVYTPVKILDNVAAVGYNDRGTAVTGDGSLWMWGGQPNSFGQLGNGSTELTYVPTKVDGLKLRRPDSSAETTVSGFADVKADAYYAAPVAWAVENGITTGTSASAFSPDATCTTAQILTFLWRASGSPAPGAAHDADPAVAYYSDAASWALERGLTDAFSADAPATRAATVTYLWKLAGSPEAGLAPFSDVPAGADYARAVAWAVEEGITSGTGNNTFSPDSTCTRAEIMTFLYRDMA